MRVFEIDFRHLPLGLPHSCCCIGFFDGLHAGHMALIEKARQIAAAKGLASGLITFDPDPWTVFKPQEKLDHICTMKDKIQLADQAGLDLFYILHFDRAFAALSQGQFHDLLADMQVRELVAGFDFRYGAGNKGDIHSLKASDLFATTVVEQISRHNEKISSSAIEACLKNGDVLEAAELLGRFYSISGTIVHGFRRGSSLLGFPTANLDWEEEYIVPETGVYAGYVETEGKTWPAMINVGNNPTFNNQHITMEAHLFGFQGLLYEKKARFIFVQRLRDQKKFDSPDQLKQQLEQDSRQCLALLKTE